MFDKRALSLIEAEINVFPTGVPSHVRQANETNFPKIKKILFPILSVKIFVYEKGWRF